MLHITDHLLQLSRVTMHGTLLPHPNTPWFIVSGTRTSAPAIYFWKGDVQRPDFVMTDRREAEKIAVFFYT